VHVDALLAAARGVGQTVRDMESFQIEDIAGEEEQYGHAGVHEGFEHFCARWQEGVEILIEDGLAIADVLTVSASQYGAADQTGADTITAAGVVGGEEF
jgi:hypothetical protein